MSVTRCWNSLVRSVYISFFVCVQKGYRISNLKISEAFVIDFEVTFLCDFVLGVLNILRLSLEFGSQGL